MISRGYRWTDWVGLVAAPILGILSYWSLEPHGYLIAAAIAISVAAATLWISEALPLAVTALLIPVGFAATGVFDEAQAFTSFGNPVLFLVLGGYALGAAVAANGIDLWTAQGLLRHAGQRSFNVAVALLLTSALLSMILSNTATTALLLPVAAGIVNNQDDPNLSRLFMLCIAYGASIGGVATLVGSPPNAIAAGMLDIGFLEWMAFGLPVSIIMLACAIPLLWFTFRPGQKIIRVLLEPKTTLSPTSIRTLATTGLVLFLWLVGPKIGETLGMPAVLFSSASVACIAIGLLFVTRCVSWAALEKSVQWGVLLLLGGGLTLGRGLTESGAADWLGEMFVAYFGQLPLLGLMFIIVAIAVFLTELISNTAVTAKLAPVLIGIAMQLGLEAQSLVVPVAIASSMAFMLPVATPPNAMVHASGRVSQRDMMRVGIRLNLAAIFVISLYFYAVISL